MRAADIQPGLKYTFTDDTVATVHEVRTHGVLRDGAYGIPRWTPLNQVVEPATVTSARARKAEAQRAERLAEQGDAKATAEEVLADILPALVEAGVVTPRRRIPIVDGKIAVDVVALAELLRGPTYSDAEAIRLLAEQGWKVEKQDSGFGPVERAWVLLDADGDPLMIAGHGGVAPTRREALQEGLRRLELI